MKVAILGHGAEGRSALQYFQAQGAEITVFDANPEFNVTLPEAVKLVAGANYLDTLNGFDVVVRSPAIRPGAIVTDGTVTSVTKLFFDHCPAPIIGVTGSKGKGTTSSLIFDMLERSGITAHFAGNIGTPALDILDDIQPSDVVVLELSSFQLWDLNVSPRIAVVLMIEPDHLDVHKEYEEYVQAKANIARWQTPDDTVFYHPKNQDSKLIAETSGGTKQPYGKAPAAHVENGFFVIDGQKLCETSELQLPGEHNVENACAAISAAWQYTQNTEAIVETLRTFSGLDHRLKLVGEKHGVQYYDDSIATTPGSAIAALHAFSQPKILILGGSSKGADFRELATEMTRADIRSVFLIGDEARRIAADLEDAQFNNYKLLGSDIRMHDIVELAADTAQSGDVVILSPACASFGMFENYKDRGDQFIRAVQQL